MRLFFCLSQPTQFCEGIFCLRRLIKKKKGAQRVIPKIRRHTLIQICLHTNRINLVAVRSISTYDHMECGSNTNTFGTRTHESCEHQTIYNRPDPAGKSAKQSVHFLVLSKETNSERYRSELYGTTADRKRSQSDVSLFVVQLDTTSHPLKRNPGAQRDQSSLPKEQDLSFM